MARKPAKDTKKRRAREEEPEEEELEDEDDDLEEEEELTAEDVAEMSRSDLVDLIEAEDLDVDPDDYKGRKKLDELRDAVAEELFGDEDEDEDEDEEDDDEDEEDEEFSEDDIMSMKKEDLLELIEENDLDVQVKKNMKLKALREAVVEAYFEEEDEDEEEDEEEEEEFYTEDELKKKSKAELVEIILELQEGIDGEDDE